jgi:hypothetical protein
MLSTKHYFVKACWFLFLTYIVNERVSILTSRRITLECFTNVGGKLRNCVGWSPTSIVVLPARGLTSHVRRLAQARGKWLLLARSCINRCVLERLLGTASADVARLDQGPHTLSEWPTPLRGKENAQPVAGVCAGSELPHVLRRAMLRAVSARFILRRGQGGESEGVYAGLSSSARIS